MDCYYMECHSYHQRRDSYLKEPNKSIFSSSFRLQDSILSVGSFTRGLRRSGMPRTPAIPKTPVSQ